MYYFTFIQYGSETTKQKMLGDHKYLFHIHIISSKLLDILFALAHLNEDFSWLNNEIK